MPVAVCQLLPATAHDSVKGQFHKGKTRQADVIAALGNPPQKAEIMGKQVWTYTYTLIPAMPFQPNTFENTVVEFDKKGVFDRRLLHHRSAADDAQGQPLVRIQRDRELPLRGQIPFDPFIDDIHHQPGGNIGQVQGFGDGRSAEIQCRDLGAFTRWQFVNHDQQARVLNVRHQNLATGGDVIGAAHSKDVLQLGGKGIRVLQLAVQAAI